MVEQIANWALSHIDIVLAIPIVTSLGCVLLHQSGLVRVRLREAVYLSAALSLAAGYSFALSYTFAPLVNILIIAPQTFILIGMASVVIACKLLMKNYRAPSPWWVLLVAVIGHGWTHLWLYALSGARS